jgi:GNAT superfamily N-acetyltransferase
MTLHAKTLLQATLDTGVEMLRGPARKSAAASAPRAETSHVKSMVAKIEAANAARYSSELAADGGVAAYHEDMSPATNISPDTDALTQEFDRLQPEGASTSPEANTSISGDVPFVPIRSLEPRHRSRIAAHLLDLSANDRYLRFGYHAGDEQIKAYVDGLNFDRDEIYGIFNRRLELIAMAHLALASEPSCTDCAEFGVSVAQEARGKRLGTRLFERAITHARAEGVEMLFIHALAENTAMLKIAKNAGARVETTGGETEAYVQLPPANLETRVEDVVEDGLGVVDYRLKLRAKQFWALLATARRELREVRNEVRETVKALRQDSKE